MSEDKTGYPMQAQDGGYPPSYPPQQGYPPQQEYPPQQGHPPQQGYPPQEQNVVIRQTQVQPNDYLAFAIIVTICCCLPLGIVAIIKATDVRNRFAAGDYQGAEDASQSAKKWSIAGLVTGIIIIVLAVVFYFVIYAIAAAALVATSSSQFTYNY